MRLYEKSAGIKKHFDCKERTITATRKFIQEHPERYTAAGTVGNLTNVICFADAYKCRKLEVETLPPFEPEEIAKVVMLEGLDDARL